MSHTVVHLMAFANNSSPVCGKGINKLPCYGALIVHRCCWQVILWFVCTDTTCYISDVFSPCFECFL